MWLFSACEWQEIRKASATQDDKPSALELLTEIADRAKLLITPSGDMFARVPVNDHKETVSINEKGSGFRRWLIYCFDKEHGYVPNSEAMTQIMERVKSKTEYEGEQVKIYTRIAEKDGRVYLDMCNDKWECIEISSTGWKVIADTPVCFRRSNGMLPLPMPQRGGTLDDLRSIINVKTERDFVLITSWLLGTLHPNGPYAVLNLNGERGSGKTRAETYLRNIIDPNEAPTRNAPRDERDAAILAKNNMIIALDNLSSIPLWLSDVLCRTATGSGFSTRALYEDELEKIFNSKRPIILNGIEDGIISQGDLLSRTILVTLEPPDCYIAEEAIDQLFQELHPKILGALLQATSMALRDRKKVTLETTPRMVDFALWVTAAEPALSWEPGTFIHAFTENQESSATIITETSPVAKAIQQFLENRNSHQFVGLMSELLTELQKHEVYSKAKNSPTTASRLGGQIKRLAPVLRSQGIAIHQARSSQGSTIAISCIASVGKTDESVGKSDLNVGKISAPTHRITEIAAMGDAKEIQNSVGSVGKMPLSSIPFHRTQNEEKKEGR